MKKFYNSINQPGIPQWHQRLGNFGGMDCRKWEGILGDGKFLSHPVGSRGEDPIVGIVNKPPSWYLFWKWM